VVSAATYLQRRPASAFSPLIVTYNRPFFFLLWNKGIRTPLLVGKWGHS
jgi:hypothetical protein